MLIDAGVGDKMSAKAVEHLRHRPHATTSITRSPTPGLSPRTSTSSSRRTCTSITPAASPTLADGVLVPRFPNARVRRPARRVGGRDAPARAQPRQLPRRELRAAARGRACSTSSSDDGEVLPGISVWRTGGHTMHHQIVWIESGGRTAVFAADLIPTAAHLDEPWIMGYDLYPMDTLRLQEARSSREADRRRVRLSSSSTIRRFRPASSRARRAASGLNPSTSESAPS